MTASFGGHPHTTNIIQVGWKDPIATFVRELKNLKAVDLSDIKAATRRGFELLNQYRLIYNNDTYGQVLLMCPLRLRSVINAMYFRIGQISLECRGRAGGCIDGCS
jgi:hypothetical protein